MIKQQHSTSLEAYRSLDLPELEKIVLDAIEYFGENGCIQDELIQYCDGSHKETSHNLTPRFAPLERKGFIFRAGDTRVGASGRKQKVMRHIKWASHVPIVKTQKKKNPFVAGMIHAAKILLDSPDLETAKKKLALELNKSSSL